GIHATAAMLVYLITRRLLGSALAIVAVLLEVAFFLPLAPSRGVPFLIPYPAWYVSLAALAVAFLLQRTRPSAARFLVSGALAGAAFAMKVNSGVLLAAAAASVAVLAGERREAGPAGKAVLGLVGLGSVLLVAETGLTISAWVLAPPVLGLAWLGRGRSAPSLAAAPRLAAEVSTLALVPLAVWAAIGALRRRADPALLGPAAVAALATLQLYPRPDFEHLTQVAPVLLPLGLRAWRR